MKTNHRIYIPSKGRADICQTAKLLDLYDIPYTLVVEPQDVHDYCKHNNADMLKIDKNDMGIAYARNFIKKYSTAMGEKYHWQIDDNISSFKRRIDKKNVKDDPLVCLSGVENYVDKYKNIGAAGLKHVLFAWSAKDAKAFNSQVYSCVLFNNALDLWWRDELIEDTDYSLQILFANYCTVIFNRLIIDKATTMKMKGGNTEISHGGDGRRKRSENLQKQWPGIFKLTEQYGRVKVKPSRIWRTFKQRPSENEPDKSSLHHLQRQMAFESHE